MNRAHLQLKLLSGTLIGLVQVVPLEIALAQTNGETPVAPAITPAATTPAATTPEATTPAATTEAVAPKADTDLALATSPATNPNVATSSDRITALEQKLEAQSTRIEELEGTVTTLSEQQSTTGSEETEDRRLSAWGFFDVTFGRAFFDNAQALYGAAVSRAWSFMSNGVNLYLKSEMTKELSAMVETRLTYCYVSRPMARRSRIRCVLDGTGSVI